MLITNKHLTGIAYLGPPGSYSHIAAKQYGKHYLNNNIFEHSCSKFPDIIKMVEYGFIEYGILPIKNSTSGFIKEVYDLLKSSTYHIKLIRTIQIPIQHCILATNKITCCNKIKKIYSHPQPFLQCSKLLNIFPHWKIIYCKSTSSAIQKVATLNSPTIAALGSKFGGIIYNLQVIKANISNNKLNLTNFIIIKHKK